MFKNFSTLPLMDADDGLGGAGAEVAEVAEPQEEEVTESAENEEVAEPQRTEQDRAFADQRRRIEELERQNKEYEDALGYFFDGDDKQLQARALAEERPLEEVKAESEAMQRLHELEEQNAELQEKNVTFEVERRMAEDLQTLKGLDPNLSSLEELGETYFNCIEAGLSATDAYYASKAKMQAEKIIPPTNIGKVNSVSEPKDFFTRDEVQNMSKSEVKANYDAIRKSMTKW